MNTRHSFRWLWPVLVVVCLTVPFLANKAATQPQDAAADASVKTAGGLTVVTFNVNSGTIAVNLPDDMRAGDTISGTVICEPKGNTKEVREENRLELSRFEIKLKFVGLEEQPKKVGCGNAIRGFTGMSPYQDDRANALLMELFDKMGRALAQMNVPVQTHPSGAIITPDPKITPPGMTAKGAVITPDPKITPPGMTAKGAVITPDPKITPPMTPSGAIITPDPKITPRTHPSGAIITPDPKITPGFIIPLLGQTGRPIVITGPFDGNASNTTLQGSAQRTLVQDFEKNTENASGGFGLIAESPRKAVFRSPENVVGPIKITLKEGDKQTTGTFRNVGVDLTAPKTSLLKGESTELRVQVNGLEGIKTPIPLTLECTGVITMQGGIYQPLMIQPSQVGADGRYTTTRAITGVQAGGWGATATVVTGPFNVCLQDDSRFATVILWNTVSGDYSFRPPGGSSAPQTGGAPLTGKGTMVMKGCVLTLQHNAPDRRIFATLDTCTQTGGAAVESSSPKVKFTITDRNIADNTCPS
jgi:hypothetical protein